MDPAWGPSVRTALSLALQHHPLCHHFATDRFRLGRVAVCSGCAMAVPGLALGVAAAYVLLMRGIGPLPMVAAGFVLGGPQGLTYLVRFSRPVRAAIKLLGGTGLGAAALAWVFAPVPFTLWWGAPAVLGLAFIGLQALRLRSILSTCRRCPWGMDWEHCPGFRVGADAPAEDWVPVASAHSDSSEESKGTARELASSGQFPNAMQTLRLGGPQPKFPP